MTLIQYYPGESLFHRLDPRVKILILLLLTVVIFIVENFFVIAIIFATILALWTSARLPLKAVASYFKFLLSLFVFLTILQALFYPGTRVLVHPIIPDVVPLLGGSGTITVEGLLFGLLICFRLLVLVCLLPLITMTTPIHMFALGLVRMGMTYRIAYTATTAINMIPTLQTETGVIIDAQRLRGFTVFEKGTIVQKMRAYPALVVPLVIGAMRRAQLMGVAMDARAFGALDKRSYVEDIAMRPMDWVAAGVLVVYSAATLLANFTL
ncbi:MAG TPA: energy-coupling factor transporter transmembrane component T [Bacillota bacterium]